MTVDLAALFAEGRVAVVAAVVERDGAFLVALRPEGKRHGRMWEFPGGKVGEGESIAEAISRELAEELAVDVTSVGDLLHAARDPGSAFEILFYEVRVSGEPRALEHAEVRWVRPHEMGALPLAPADARFAAARLETS